MLEETYPITGGVKRNPDSDRSVDIRDVSPVDRYRYRGRGTVGPGIAGPDLQHCSQRKAYAKTGEKIFCCIYKKDKIFAIDYPRRVAKEPA